MSNYSPYYIYTTGPRIGLITTDAGPDRIIAKGQWLSKLEHADLYQHFGKLYEPVPTIRKKLKRWERLLNRMLRWKIIPHRWQNDYWRFVVRPNPDFNWRYFKLPDYRKDDVLTVMLRLATKKVGYE